jgi:hypothetical protein
MAPFGFTEAEKTARQARYRTRSQRVITHILTAMLICWLIRLSRGSHHPESLFRHWESIFYPTTNADANNDLSPRQLSLPYIYDDFPASSCSKHPRSARQDVESGQPCVPPGQCRVHISDANIC